MSGLYEFIKDQYATLPIAITPQEAKGKTYVVTGANTGLGFECAKHLVRLGSTKVIIAVRSLKKGDEAKAKIEVETGNKGIAEVWHLDLSSYESVKKFAKKLQALDRVDAVIENASVAMSTRTEAEGLETTLTVNIISTFLLALLVLPKLEETAKKFGGLPHLVIVGSGAGFSAKGSFEQIQGDIIDGLDKAPLEGTKRYPESKLFQLYAVRQLAMLRPVSKTGVVINYISPGLCVTELDRNAPMQFRIFLFFMRLLLGRTAEYGSRTLVQAAVAGKESHGKYLSECRIRDEKVPSYVTDDSGKKVQERVWESLTKKLNAIQPGCV